MIGMCGYTSVPEDERTFAGEGSVRGRPGEVVVVTVRRDVRTPGSNTFSYSMVEILKPGPHQQHCRSNIVECYNVECCFGHCCRFWQQCRSNVRLCCQKRQQCRTSFALKFRPFDKVERCFDNVAKVACCFDSVASTLLLVWTGLNAKSNATTALNSNVSDFYSKPKRLYDDKTHIYSTNKYGIQHHG